MSDFNTDMITRVDAYADAMVKRYEFYLETVFFPETGGRRKPLFTEALSEREEFLRLRQAAEKSVLVAQGKAQPDTDTQMFMDNRDGAQERYAALLGQYGGAQ